MVTMGTAVFRRIVGEAKQEGFNQAKQVGVSALTDTMLETWRFGGFSRDYVGGCAKNRWEHYFISENPSCGTQVSNVPL